jgi:hypothetical protein
MIIDCGGAVATQTNIWKENTNLSAQKSNSNMTSRIRYTNKGIFK